MICNHKYEWILEEYGRYHYSNGRCTKCDKEHNHELPANAFGLCYGCAKKICSDHSIKFIKNEQGNQIWGCSNCGFECINHDQNNCENCAWLCYHDIDGVDNTFTEDTCVICKWKCTAHEWDSSGNCRICDESTWFY